MQNSNDPFAFLKAQWPDLGNSFQMPQAAMSSLDPQVIDKRIEDLKTVEQWLSFNLNLVKSTIQGLEIQKGTLAAIQSFQQSMQDFAQPSDSASEQSSEQTNEARPAQSPHLNQAAMAQASDWWNGMQQQFQHFVQAAQQATQQTADQPEGKAPTATKSASTKKKTAPGSRSRTAKPASRRTASR
jgi:hypothetical protein